MRRGIWASCALLWLLWLLSGPSAIAAKPGFRLLLSSRGLTADQVPTLSDFVREVERSIPARVQARLAQAVLVAFDLRPDPPQPPQYSEPQIAAPECPQPGFAPSTQAVPMRRPQELARLEAGSAGESVPLIRLHRGFRDIIARGPQAAPRYPCGHRSLYRLAVATLLHEVLHLYDARAGLSRDPRYRHLQRFDRQGLLRRMAPRNLLAARSPDPYEGASLAESLAVNGEYFLLDPEYRCRRPASYAFFEAALRLRPFPQAPCPPRWTVYHRGAPLRLDPDRIYQVHYLMAARGQGLASRFGHSMFRLVVCADDRERVGPECLDDVQDHIVIGFGANLQSDLQISAWKGLTGGYVSQLFVRPLPEVLIEYTEREQRALESLPLRLDRDALRQLIGRAVEIYWSYEGRYFFLTNNCASEALSLLQSASADPALHRISRMTPAGLRDDLLRLGLIDQPALPAGAAGLLIRERLGLYFPSLLSRHEAWYGGLRMQLPAQAPRTLRSYLHDTQAHERRVWLQALDRLPATQAVPLSAQAFALEGLILGLRFAELERRLSRFVLGNLDKPQPLLGELRALLPRLGIERPWQQTVGGYGIPLPQEVRRPPDLDRDAAQQRLWQQAQRIARATFPAELAEWQQTQENRRRLAAQVVAGSAALRAGVSSGAAWSAVMPSRDRGAEENSQQGGAR